MRLGFGPVLVFESVSLLLAFGDSVAIFLAGGGAAAFTASSMFLTDANIGGTE